MTHYSCAIGLLALDQQNVMEGIVTIKKQELPKTMISFVWYFLKDHKLHMLAFILCAIFLGVYGVISSYIMKILIDLIVTIKTQEIMRTCLWPIVIFLVINLMSNISWRILSYIKYKTQLSVKNNIIIQTCSYVYNHSYQFFQDNFSGEISNNVTMLADNLESIIYENSVYVIRIAALLIASLYSMYFVHPFFFCILLIWTISFLFFSFVFSRKIQNISECYGESQSMVSGKIVDTTTNASSMNIFSSQDHEVIDLSKALMNMKLQFQRKELFFMKFSFVHGLYILILIALMVYLLIDLRLKGLVTIGDFVLILGLVSQITDSSWNLTDIIHKINGNLGWCKQSIKKLFVPNSIKDKPNVKDLIVSHGEISFNNVCFSYETSKELFQNMSIKILPKEKVGLVGCSGDGKSTFVNLILRLYDVHSGSILIDGQDIKSVTQKSLRSAISVIPQDPYLFHRSILENISYGSTHTGFDDVIQAAKLAHAHDFISQLPLGYNSIIGERGVKLSGGQRQCIAIARAILNNASILIMDEATSQLDSLTEMNIKNSLKELMENKTTIIIAHRLSSLVNMDRILVFKSGKIVENGNHEKLLLKNGIYKKLWDQLQL
jgi:ATP-binding cassette subfamily B protein